MKEEKKQQEKRWWREEKEKETGKLDSHSPDQESVSVHKDEGTCTEILLTLLPTA